MSHEHRHSTRLHRHWLRWYADITCHQPDGNTRAYTQLGPFWRYTTAANYMRRWTAACNTGRLR